MVGIDLAAEVRERVRKGQEKVFSVADIRKKTLVWTIKYTDTARTLLRKIDKQTAGVLSIIWMIEFLLLENPSQKGKALKGLFGGLWRCRVGDFRIIFDIQDRVLCILVVKIENRRDVYR